MSAITKSSVREDTFASHYLPHIERKACLNCRHLPCHLREDAIQEIVCMAFLLYLSACRRGLSSFTADSLTRYAMKLYRSGRRFGGRSTADAMGTEAIRLGRSTCYSLEQLQKALSAGATPLGNPDISPAPSISSPCSG